MYHCISRVVGGQMRLDDLEKQKLTTLLGRLAEFCGVEVITYCMISNHFHQLIRVPVRVELSDAELLAKLVKFYGKKGILTILAQEGLKLPGGRLMRISGPQSSGR